VNSSYPFQLIKDEIRCLKRGDKFFLSVDLGHHSPSFEHQEIWQCCKFRSGTGICRKASIDGDSGCHFKEFVDEPILTPDVIAAQPPHWPFRIMLIAS
jgi:hypothetical protein